MILIGTKKYKTINPSIIKMGDKQYSGRKLLAQTKAIITRATIEGFTLPDTQGIADIDAFIAELVNNAVWDFLDYLAIYAYNNTSLLNFSRINWKRPFDPLAVINGGVIYEPAGIKGNGVNGYVNLNSNPVAVAGNFTRDNAYLGAVVYSPGLASQDIVVGQVAGGGSSPRRITNLTSGNANGLNINSPNLGTMYNMSGTGYKAIGRNSSTTIDLVNKDVFTGAISSNSVAMFSESNVLLRHVSTYSVVGISCFFSGGYINNTKAQAFRVAYNKWLNKKSLTQIA